MRARMVAAFVAGMAIGSLILVVGLWRSGTLQTRAAASMERSAPAPAAIHLPEASGLPDTKAGEKFRPPAEIPALAPAQPPQAVASRMPSTLPNSNRGSADRIAPGDETIRELASKDLMLPVMGVNRNALIDTFNESRAGTRRHEALDIMAPRGTPVLAVEEGNVAKLFNSQQGGLTVYQFDNGKQWCYYYAHLDRYADNLKEGTLLRKGETLGYVGSTGDADPNAPHLHFAIFRLGPEKRWWEGAPVNPFPLFRE